MADKGSINKMPGKGGPLYGKAPLVLGMYEAQVNRLTPQLELDVRAYMDETFGRALHTHAHAAVQDGAGQQVHRGGARRRELRRYPQVRRGQSRDPSRR